MSDQTEFKTTHYVTFLTPGVFLGESWSQDVDSPDPKRVEWPNHAYAFTLHKREDAIKNGRTYKGTPEQIGPTYYHPDSYVQSLDEVRANPKATQTLIDNMRFNKWKQIIWTRWNNWPQPFDPEDTKILR